MKTEPALKYKDIPKFEEDDRFAKLLRRWKARRFDLDNPPEETPPFLTINGISVSTRGNLTVISAQVKSGKTAFVGAILAALMSVFKKGRDFLGIEADTPDGIVVHLDTEQGNEDYHRVMKRVLSRANIDTLPPWLVSASVRDWTPSRIKYFLPRYLKKLKSQGKKIEALIIDGVADLVYDTNDLRESKRLVSLLLRISQRYQCAVIAVIHLNHGSETKATGHLGSQLEKKAETVIRLSKKEEIVTVSVPVSRRAPISPENGPQFMFNEGLGMHVSLPSKKDQKNEAHSKAHKEVLRSLFEDDFTNQKSRADLKKAFSNHFAVKVEAAEKIVQQLTGKQWLLNGIGKGQWMLSKELQEEFDAKTQ